MRCPDCKGSGEYVGARVVEPCQRCKGLGALDVKGKPDVPKNAMDPADAGLPDWMDDYVDQIENATRMDEFARREIFTSKLQKGDTVYVYNLLRWYKATAVLIMTTRDGSVWVYADVHPSYAGTFEIPYNDICYNDTQKRWEYIKCGTPTYP